VTCITQELPAMTLPSTDFLLIAGRAVFLVFSFIVAAISFTAWRRATSRQTAEVLSQTQLVLQRLAQLETRVEGTRITVTELSERLDRPPATASAAPPSPGYQIAIRLARGGASREELMSGCGLTLAEAELIRRLHGPRTPELRQVS
jgi:alkylation response protein AidB-like acyl-CoA dehydrogenase